jgi:hypothetical protein
MEQIEMSQKLTNKDNIFSTSPLTHSRNDKRACRHVARIKKDSSHWWNLRIEDVEKLAFQPGWTINRRPNGDWQHCNYSFVMGKNSRMINGFCLFSRQLLRQKEGAALCQLQRNLRKIPL